MMSNTALLTILIPTYNRAAYVQQNLEELCSHIEAGDLSAEVDILISNNASPDDTVTRIDAVHRSHPAVRMTLVTQPENIGSVRNVLYLLGAATSHYVLFLGDDDYMDAALLENMIQLCRAGKIHLAVPGNTAISIEGQDLGYGRDLDKPETHHQPGRSSCLFFAWRGHQMSGLLFRRDGLMAACREHDITNMYLFIYLVAFSALRGPAAHLPSPPVRVSAPTQHAKGWSYGDDGMIGEVFINFAMLESIGPGFRCLLEMKFLWVQYWRYAMYLKLGLPAFLRCIWKISCNTWTSWPTRVLFPLSLPVVLPLKTLELALKGELIGTLNRKVDI